MLCLHETMLMAPGQSAMKALAKWMGCGAFGAPEKA